LTLVVGIPCCTRRLDDELHHATPARYGAALLATIGAVPLLIPPTGEAQIAVLDRLDGVLVSGSPSNVEPHHYGGGISVTPDSHDPARDATTLPLIREAVRRGTPLLAICRGIQELNVALGGTLHQTVHGVPGRGDHRAPEGSNAIAFGKAHAVALSGRLATIMGAQQIQVNSLHGQAIDRLAPGLVAEAVAEDGTIEGVRLETATGFVVGVQFHPEWEPLDDPPSLALFRAFGEACRGWAAK